MSTIERGGKPHKTLSLEKPSPIVLQPASKWKWLALSIKPSTFSIYKKNATWIKEGF
jgi:hypothetical protein